MSYELGQQAALEKIGVFIQYLQPAGIRTPHVRGRGANVQEATANAISNINKKYMHRAPIASQRLIDVLHTPGNAMPAANVERIIIGGLKGDSSPNASYNRITREVQLNMEHAPQGTLAHEYGHSMPGAVLDRLPEEARATQNYINALGQAHKDVPASLRAFGTYLQSAFPPPWVEAVSTPAQRELIKKWTAAGTSLNDRAEVKTLRKRRLAAIAPLQKAKTDAISALAERYADRPDILQKRRKAVAAYYDPRIYEMGRKYNKAENVIAAKVKRQNDFAAAVSGRGVARIPTPTLADYAKLQGAEREQLDSWIASMRDKIDQHFWAGAGDTALEPILKRLEELRSAQ